MTRNETKEMYKLIVSEKGLVDYIGKGVCRIEKTIGVITYWLDGKLHREDGPAVEWDIMEYSQYRYYWWLNGECFTKEEFDEKINERTGN